MYNPLTGTGAAMALWQRRKEHGQGAFVAHAGRQGHMHGDEPHAPTRASYNKITPTPVKFTAVGFGPVAKKAHSMQLENTRKPFPRTQHIRKAR